MNYRSPDVVKHIIILTWLFLNAIVNVL